MPVKLTTSSAPLPFWDYSGAFSTRALVEEATTFISHVFPPLLCYGGMAVLVVMPQTRTIRLALCPVMVLLALRAAIPMDMSFKHTERRFHNNLAVWMFVMTLRTIDWGLARKPLVRQLRPANSAPSALLDALSLVSSFRGYDWDWSHGVHIPRETRPADRTRFIFYTILSATVHAALFFIIHMAIRSFLYKGSVLDETLPFLHRAIGICSFVGLGKISAGSIFDETLPFYPRYIRSSLISLLALVWNYTGLQAVYDLGTIPAVLILGHDPTQWPPIFDAPWRATSLTDFWGRRWHQLLRRIFLFLGGHPLYLILGRDGRTIGSFLASAVYHHIRLIAFNSKSEFWRMLVGFGMMAPGIIMEHRFRRITERKVQGIAGWVWTMSWILLWGSFIADGLMRAGQFGFPTPLDLVPPVRMLVERMVTNFDDFLLGISLNGLEYYLN